MNNLSNGSRGKIAIINIYGCNKIRLTDKMYLSQFSKELCKQIQMKPHGEPMVERFGTGYLEGYSMLQFIETSSITVHLDEKEDRAFIDIFSCKDFDEKEAEKFSKHYFEGETSACRVHQRR